MRPTKRRHALFLAVALAWVAACGGKLLAQERPQALERMVAYRAALQTGQIELRKTFYWRAGALDGQPRTMFKSVRIAPDRQIQILRGDQDGIVIRSISGGAASRSPQYRLECPTESWDRSEDSVHARRFAHPDRTYRDLRTLGTGAAFGRGDIHDVVWTARLPAPAAREYEESREGDLWVVRVRSGNFTRTYWLDPSRGWSPVRVRRENEGGFWTESRSVLELMDGVWFPRTVLYFSSNHCDGEVPREAYEVDGAEFNRPDHPMTFTLADIGIDVGMLVTDPDRRIGGVGPSTMGKWDGERVVSFEEYNKRRLADEIREGPLLIALLERRTRGSVAPPASANGGTGGVSSTKDRATESGVSPAGGTKGVIVEAEGQVESQWEAYTRHFIERYRLNKEQSDKAWAILKDCQERANRYLAKRERDFEKLDKEAEAARKSDTKDRAQRLPAIDKRHRKLMQPIDDIFEKQLKPRLEKLPTSAQRRAAEGPEKATSKPSKAGDGHP
jgi:hypothetical protein